MHRQHPDHHHAKKPSPFRYKFTLIAFIAFGAVSGALLAQEGWKAWWYVAACVIVLVAVVIGEGARR